ncbi:MAG: L,D-transpeptidase [Pseudomonadota bacterium]
MTTKQDPGAFPVSPGRAHRRSCGTTHHRLTEPMPTKQATTAAAPTRRAVSLGLLSACAVTVAGCRSGGVATGPSASVRARRFSTLYGPRPDERFPIPAVKPERLAPHFMRQEVDYRSPERPGTVIVDTENYFLYLVGRGGRAMRYGVGLGRQGFEWSGRGTIAWKRKWPTWTPPAEMIAREPRLRRFSAANGGMAPGLRNPLGARALYIHQNGKDTLYRLHGTRSARSIGKAVSSGCVRLVNQDVIDLYERVRPGARIVVV